MNTTKAQDIAIRLEKAAFAYHNGLPLLMTDEAFDTACDELKELDPTNPFFSKVGAPVIGDEVVLPIPLPSLNKMKDKAAIDKWSAKATAPTYHLSAKLDGVSALWLPASKKLYTRGDGVRGRDISAFAPYFVGLLPSTVCTAVRGELIMRTDSALIPAGKLARNIVAGALNRKEADPALFGEIRFVAYELISGNCDPEDGYKRMRAAGFETARAAIIPAANLNDTKLSQIFEGAESKSPYNMDGIVVAPNVARPPTYTPSASNPTDRAAWKTRLTAQSARTIVRSVDWNVSHQGFLIPRVLFDTVKLAGANIGAATGLHGRWIFDNKIGPGAEIEVRRAGDVIPQIIAVHAPGSDGAAMPPKYSWDAGNIHIKAADDDASLTSASACVQLTHALGELGAENVGAGIVAKMYAAGFTDLKKIYAASTSELATKVEGCKEKGADRIWHGLRVKQHTWTELNFMVASCTMPRSVGHTKLTPLLALNPNPATWNAATLKANRPAGLSDTTIDAIVGAIPAYLSWKAATGLVCLTCVKPIPAKKVDPVNQIVVVFTGVRDKALEGLLQERGHTVADTVTKKTTHVVHGGIATSTKIIKAKEMGITIQSLSEFRANLELK